MEENEEEWGYNNEKIPKPARETKTSSSTEERAFM